MYNVIKMDIYRLLHTVSFYVMLVVSALLAAFTVYMTKLDLEGMAAKAEEPGVYAEGTDIQISLGFTFDTKAEWNTEDIVFSDFMEIYLNSGFCLLLQAIFVSVFVYAEQKNGYVKNIAGQISHRWMLVVSKVTAVALQMFAMFLSMGTALFAVGKCCFGEKMVLDFTMKAVKVFFVQYFLHFAFACLILCLCTLFKSMALGMTMGIMLSSKTGMILYSGINVLAERVFKIKEFDVSRYAIEMCVGEYSAAAAEEVLQRSVMVGVVYVAVTVLVAAVVFEKRDIK